MSELKNCVICFVIIGIGVISGKRLGDPCTIESTGKLGECKLFNDCDETPKKLLRNSKICSFHKNEKLICCAKDTILQRVKKEIKSDNEPGAISKAKCKEYSKYVYERQKQPILLIDAPEIKKNECGHQVVKLIIGGEPASQKEFPHMAVIGFEQTTGDIQWFGGGSIISEKFILTAAHCLESRTFGPAKYVRLGITNLNENNNRKQEIKVSERIPHPQYNSNSHYYDIGLLKLEKKIKMNPYARPACLYLNREVKAELAIATGWGHTSFAGEISADLLKVTLDLFDHNSCNNTKSFKREKKLSKGILDEIQLCAGSKNSSVEKDTCQGDSGGPLQLYHTGDDIECMYDIIGITSFGKACGGPSPGVYSRVSHFIKWIEDIVWP